jgi:hypothetical protein
MSSSDGKLFATAMGAATAGAALAVMAMKMIESNNSNNINRNKNGSGNNYGTSESTNNLLAYHADENRPIRPSVIMNDPSDLVGEGISASIGAIKRESSEAMLFPHNHEAKMRRRIATRYTIEEENNLGRDSVTVRVPATSANVGPGCKLSEKWQMQCSTMQLRCYHRYRYFLRVAHSSVSLSLFLSF